MRGQHPVSCSTIGFVALFLLLVALTTGVAAVEECQYHHIEETLLPKAFTCIEVGPDDAVYGWSWHALWRSEDRGDTWEVVRTFADTVNGSGIFVASSGDVFLGLSYDGRLWKGVPGVAWSWTTPLVFHCSSCDDPADNSRMWKMDEDSSGNLYVGEYGGAWGDTCAYIHRSEDGGDTWATVYSCSSRHVHFVRVDPYTDQIYASIGDGAGRHRLVSSSDGGANWDVLYTQDCLAQPTSIVFTPGQRVLGSDCWWIPNRIYATTDDQVFETRLLLSGNLDSYVWDMSKNADGYIYAGTKAKLSGGSEACLYASYNGGEDWCTVKSFGLLPEWNGVRDISSFDSEGWGYYTYSASPGVFSAFRFRDEDTSSVDEDELGLDDLLSLTARPSPFRSSSGIGFRLPDAGARVSLRVYNLRGECLRTLADGFVKGGRYEITWDGRSETGDIVCSGVYFVRLHAKGVSSQTKVLVLR